MAADSRIAAVDDAPVIHENPICGFGFSWIGLGEVQDLDRPLFHDRIDMLYRSHSMVGVLGPRQCGKTTLARAHIARPGVGRVHYFDLEDPAHLNRLEDAKLALSPLDGMVVIDEVQRRPALFPLLRVLIDRRPLKQRYLILGSASRELLHQSSETLAGRIAYLELPPFAAFEAHSTGQLWLRGGFPPAYLSATDDDSMVWRRAYISTFLERDVPALGIDLPAAAMRRFWMMLAHWHGRLFNAAELARSLDVSPPTAKRYLDVLAGTFMVRVLQPWHANIGKRQVKSPKVYLRDSGVLHALLALPTMDALRNHPAVGASWEGFALEQVIALHQAEAADCFFWATHTGAELDLLIVQGGRKVAFEFKYSSTPKATRSMWAALESLGIDQITIVCPGQDTYPLAERIRVTNLAHLAKEQLG